MNSFEYLLEEVDANKAKFVSQFVDEWIQLKKYVDENPMEDIHDKWGSPLDNDEKSSDKIFIEGDEWFQITVVRRNNFIDNPEEFTKYWLVSNIDKLYDFYYSLTTSKRFEKMKSRPTRNVLGGNIPLVDLESFMKRLYLSPKQFAEKIYDTYVSLDYLF